ncbi:MAG: hypothetical protein ACN6O5_15190 [Achromobacter sp.]|uniref:hypothetical protein n=1 Tax=Achromobacter sp. TaxID=134375 RepID=UPI003CFE7231
MHETSPSSKRERVALYVFAAVVAGLGAYKAFQNETGPAAVLLGAGMAAFLFANLDKIEHIKALGIEAKMRKLKETVDEAHELVGQLQALAISTARHIVTLVSSDDGYVETYSRRTAWEMVENVRRSLDDLNIPQAQIDDVLAPYHRKVFGHLCASFRGLVKDGAMSVLMFRAGSKDAQAVSDAMGKASTAATEPQQWSCVRNAVTEFIRSTPNDESFKHQKILESVSDLEHWQATRQLRRPEAYFS